VASWCYEAKDDYGKWITPFRDAKLDLIVCPGTANWNRVLPNLDVALPNIRDFVREGRRAGAMGALTCTWADNGDAPFDLNWYALAGGAAASWQEASLDTVRLRRAFDWALFRNPGTDVADALAAMQRNHRRVMSIRRHDANLVLFWQNPTSNPIDRRLLAALEPVAADLRLDAEKALESLLRVRPRARRNAEVIDAYAFAARRLRTIGIRAEMAKRLPQLYEDVLAKTTVGSPVANAKPVLAEMSRLLVEGRDDIVTLRAEHERLWRQENRPYWLGNVLALYDHDLEGWITKLETVRLIEFGLRSGLRPPPIEQVGLEP
jgi:hexosaminidase